ncbi:MAG: 1-acyl-sn-glycerol-3-phosphate acyltransferase [Deltaproteobacteria bacterium]|nr:1-acyl-sn-glycerol-3-phosphate acyltransferase [Deltaproteobacteria bacterium]
MFVTKLLRRATARLFDHLEVDPAWVREVEAAAARGVVVYALRHASTLDVLALDAVVRRHGLPELGFASEEPPAARLGGFAFASAGTAPDDLARALRRGDSAVLFVQRAPHGADSKKRDAALLERLLAWQRSEPTRPVTMVPVLFVWSRRSERRGFSLLDSVFGPADFPGDLRQVGQLIGNFDRAELRTSALLPLPTFLADEGAAEDAVLATRLGYALLRRLDRERRTIVGPARKPLDRAREEVVRSPKLQAVLRELAGPEPAQLAELEASARAMLDELMTVPDPEVAKTLESLAVTLLERVYSGIDVDEAGIERIREAAREGSVVLLPSHKSHVDYIVLSCVLRRRSLQLPVIAAGDNLSFFPLGPLLRRGGAFFIRRSFRGDRLYAAVVDAYIRRLLREGWMIEFFMEGGRSRSGKLLPPMLGLLSMVVSAALPLERRKVTFFPISIGYERLMEESAFARELAGGAKVREDASQLLAASRVLADRWGRVNVQVGRAIELGALREELGVASAPNPAKRRELVKRLAHRVMSEINHVTLVTPGAVVALVLLGHGKRAMAYRELIDRSSRVAERLRREGARLAPSLSTPESDALREQGFVEAMRLYVRSGLVAQHVPGELRREGRRRERLYTGTDVLFSVPDDRRIQLDFAKNQIVHFMVDRALVATALGSTRSLAAQPLSSVKERVQALSRLFKLEFMFRADATFDRNFEETIAAMVRDGEVVLEGGGLKAAPALDEAQRHDWLGFHAATLRNFVEGYLVAARGLETLLRGKLAKKELVARTLKAGQRMALRGEIERAEAVLRPLLENALESFVEQGYVLRADGSYALTPSFATESGVRAVEARIAAFVVASPTSMSGG